MIGFKICIEEMVSQTFTVMAKDYDEAINLAIRNYEQGDFVLEPGDVVARQLAITSPANEVTEWLEF